jgi:RNA polymerase sigma-70 factor, ECF subfamily
MSQSPVTRPSLLLRLKNVGDVQAWAEFDRMYRPLLVRVALKRGLQLADADEVAQDVVLAVLDAIATYVPSQRPGAFRKWLQTIATRKAIDRLTRESKHRGLGGLQPNDRLSDLPASIGDAIDRELQLQLRRQLFIEAAEIIRSRCDEPTWQAFWRTAIELKPAAQVASELKLSIGAIYVARSRIQARIREHVQTQSQLWSSSDFNDPKHFRHRGDQS